MNFISGSIMKPKTLWKTALLALTGVLSCGVATMYAQSPAAGHPARLLIVSVTKGYRHESIPTAEKTLEELGRASGTYTVDYVRTDADMAQKMTVESLKNYDGVIFASTTGILPLPDKDGFLAWIKSGKAFIGVHAATDTFHSPDGSVDPYIDMIGGEFKQHGAQVKVECFNEDPQSPATKHIGKSFIVFDEIYQFKNFSRERVHTLLGMDKHPNDGQPGYYAVAWCKKYGDGKVFYTSLGHREDVWANPVYQQHVLGGIKWALGLEPGDATPQKPENWLPPAAAAPKSNP
jgi:type 1 glutamine amidotransferase